jgi:F-box-like
MSLPVAGNIPELMSHISSFCDYKRLAALQCVSKRWHEIAGDDRLWQRLFERHFPKEIPPKTQCKEAFRKKLTPICSSIFKEIGTTIVTFLSELKLDRQFVYEFPNDPPYFLMTE